MPRTINCPQCKAPIQVDPAKVLFTCEYCGTQGKNTAFAPAAGARPQGVPAPQGASPPCHPPGAPAPQGGASPPCHPPGQYPRGHGHQGPYPPPPHGQPYPMLRARRAGGIPVWPFILGGVVLLLFFGIVAALVVVGITTSKRPRSKFGLLNKSNKYKANKYKYRSRYRFPGESSAEAAQSRKLAAYEMCIYRHSGRVLRSRARYLSWIRAPASGPTCSERHKYGPYKLLSSINCRNAVRKVRDRSPEMDALERAGTRYLAALKTLEPLHRKAERYYKQEDYEDDGCKKGKKLHGKLMAGWDRLIEWDQAIRKVVAPKRSAILLRRLKSSKKNKGVAYFYVKTRLSAQVMVGTLSKQDRATEADLAKIRKVISRFDDDLQDLEEAYRKTRASRRPLYMTLVKSRAGLLLKAAKRFRRRLESGRQLKPYERRLQATGSGWVVKGSFERVEFDYHNLLEYASKVKFR